MSLRWAAVAALVASLGACAPPDKSFQAIDITGAQYATTFSLPDAQGRVRTLEEFRGKVVVVFFGYTQCPDVCPTTLSELAAARKELGEAGQRVQGVFITVDPQRDVAQVIGAYVQAFDPSFVALRGDEDQTAAIARQFKVVFTKSAGSTPTSYTIDHTAGAYVFDTQGRIRLFTRHGTGTAALVHDLKILLAQR